MSQDKKTSKEEQEPIYVAIIGSAGRGNDAAKMNAELFEKMMCRCRDQLKKVWKLDPNRVHLVSGGSSWCDHLAVRLFLKDNFRGCTLYLPCKYENQKFDTTSRYGYVLNRIHSEFSAKAKIDSLRDIDEAVHKKGMILNTESTSFLDRNAKVASQTQYMLAFTWGNGKTPKDGGTQHTWNLCTDVNAKSKVHVPIASLQHTQKTLDFKKSD